MKDYIIVAALVMFLLVMLAALSPGLRKLFKHTLNSLLGIIGLLVTHFFAESIGIAVALNIPSVVISAVLGIPGVLAMIIAKIFIK